MSKSYRGKTWLNNIWESLLFFLATPLGFAGIAWLNSMQENDVSGAMVVNGVPLPLEIIPLLVTMAGFGLPLMGLIMILITLHRRVIKKRKSYDYNMFK